ncbi:hypothetical protein D9615_008588 [Tricholomella constricta]|uniref:Uncharacterized protein n=1 Tax=Tricholomella constricta TaxID=117010 RepID=A0A8H5H3T2_9AGAR|nr:hypothetical protein D9615_008588 [Tricholomella constricta]
MEAGFRMIISHYTSKTSSFSDLAHKSLVVTTATEPPFGVSLEMEASGKIRKRTKVARQRGTTIALTNLSAPLPVRRKELERNSKREFGKALALLNAYALGPCCTGGAGVRLTVSNQIDKGQETVQLHTSGASSTRASVSALWGPKALDNMVDLDLTFEVDRDKTSLRRLQGHADADAGDMDPPDGPPSPGVRLKGTTVVVDTTNAAWNRVVHPEKVKLPDDDMGKGSLGMNGTSGPPVNVLSREGEARAEGSGNGKERIKAKAATSKMSQDNLRTRLVGFARFGSQLSPTQSLEEGAEEGEDPEKDDATDKEEKDQLDSSDHLQRAEKSAEHGDHIQRRSTMSSTPADIEDNAGQSSSKAIDLTSDDDLDDYHITSIFEDNLSTLQQEETVFNPEVIRYPRTLEYRNTENDQRAVDALARVIDKKDFANMDIIGQFNLRYIVTRRRKTVRGEDDDQTAATMDDLFIVDQHAADEKYNFETLQ